MTPQRPLVLVHTTTGGERLYATDAAARHAGLRAGQALADAKALEPRLIARPAMPDQDKRLLQALARSCGRFSPFTAPDPGRPGEDGILLDVTGCARLFGGEDRLLRNALCALRDQGLDAHGAIAPTLGLAWGLARHVAPHQNDGALITTDIRDALAPLPVEALRIGDTAGQLRRFGFKQVSALTALPRAQLARRFGRDLVRRLDQARGQEEESLNPLLPQTPFRARLRFPEALLLLDNIKQAVHECAATLCERLEGESQGLRRVELHLYRVDGKIHLLGVNTAAPARDPAHIIRLFNEKLDRAEIDIGFGIDVIELHAPLTERLDTHQEGLIPGEHADPDSLARLTDRLGVRLGEEQVRRATRRERHLPEQAAGWRSGPALSVRESTAPARLSGPPTDRPLLILARPEPAQAVAEIPDGPPRSFVWRRLHHRVHRAEGPERLAPEWWQGELSPRTRDYFHVETREGRRFWLFREGLFGLETQEPQWFVHGAS